MRIGGAVEKTYSNPEEWYKWVEELGYRAVLTPVSAETSKAEKEAYLACVKEHDLVISEVGAWCSPIAFDEKMRKEGIAYCQKQLGLAEELGANCCVNIAGNREEKWDSYCAANYDPDTYTLIVDTVREIIDAVKPERTFYTLEPMPWMLPTSPEEYLQLIKDIDRKAFGVHLDFINMINCPERFVKRDAFIEHCFKTLGPYIKSIHGKDINMGHQYPCVLEETMPGKGCVDYQKVMKLCNQLDVNMPFMVEHLPDHESYMQAAAFVREQAIKAGVTLP